MEIRSTELSKNLPQLLKQLRTDAGYSQVRLGLKLGISCKTVSSYEKGRSLPSLEVLGKIFELFSIKIIKEEENGGATN